MGVEFKNNDQFRAFIKKEAERLGIKVSSAYSTYFSRLLLERLSQYNNGQMVVKGSFSQFVHFGKLTRPILDVDLASVMGHNIPMCVLYKAIYDVNDELVQFDLSKLPHQKKSGVYKMSIDATYGRKDDPTKIIHQPIALDYKADSSTIYELQYKRVNPIFEGDKPFYINTPSYEEHVAEKLCIVAQNKKTDTLNTRVKDFYDIYQLHGGQYDSDKFSYYFERLLRDYGKVDPDTLTTEHLNRGFVNDHQELWDRMSDKYDFMDKDVELLEAVYYTRGVLSEQLQKIRSGVNTENIVKLQKRPKMVDQ